MSKVSEISTRYKEALNVSREQYRDLFDSRIDAAHELYDQFLKTQVVPFEPRFATARSRERLQDEIERVLGTKRLQFIAIDGTCRREQFADMVTFFGGAYGARGELVLDSGDHKVHYKRWSLEQDVSMVAWVPVPFARLEEVSEGEEFVATDEEKVNLSSVHVQVMQLAEVFLAFNAVNASVLDAPHLLLMDLSPSSVLASVARAQDGIGLVGYPYDRRSLTRADIAVAMAQPISSTFGIPAPKLMDVHRLAISDLFRDPKATLAAAALAQAHGLTPARASASLEWLEKRGVLDAQGAPLIDATESWEYTKSLFQNICRRLFLQKDPGALQYDAADEYGVLRRRWMSPDDLGFLVAVGMRMLIESCWERKVLLYGVVKDSSSRYFARNYLGVALETGYHPELAALKLGMLPWTDRILCEAIPAFDPDLAAPWATVEFDSAFMTLHREKDPASGATKVAGVMGRIVNQERLFMKSLGQFFLTRDKPKPLMGHVVFLERLVHPAFDAPGRDGSPDELLIRTPEIGAVSPFVWRDVHHANQGQTVMMYLLSVLTKNHFAEAIGYPDPLHKADWGAKSMGRWVGQTIESSTRVLATDPMSNTFRTTRDSAGR